MVYTSLAIRRGFRRNICAGRTKPVYFMETLPKAFKRDSVIIERRSSGSEAYNMGSLRQRLKRYFCRLSILVLLVTIRAGLRIFTFARVLRWLDSIARALPNPPPLRSPDRTRISRMIATTGRYALGGESCLVQALAVRFVFHCYGVPVRLRIGVAKGDDRPLCAHAWAEADNSILIGGPVTELSSYTPLLSIEGA